MIIEIAKYLILTINIAMFLIFGYDKLMAKRKGQRIPESFLLAGSFFFGAFGSLLGMVVFNHKTSKLKFRLTVPFFLFLNYSVFRNDFLLIKLLVQMLVAKT